MENLTFKHSFNSGDLITVLPGIKHMYEQTGFKAIVYQRIGLPADYGHNDPHPVKSEDGRHVCMNMEMFKMMKPLIEAQEYIERFEIWEGQEVQFDYDKTRQSSQMPLPGGDIHKWPSLIYPQLECQLDDRWIKIPKRLIEFKYHDMIYINLTERYRNPYINYYFLRTHENICRFLGTEKEHEIFCNQWGLNIRHLESDNFLFLAKMMTGCRFFIGNQSLCWHIADAMKVPRILEVCAQYPNTFPTGKNGRSFILQESLEFLFHKFLNEDNVSTSESNPNNS